MVKNVDGLVPPVQRATNDVAAAGFVLHVVLIKGDDAPESGVQLATAVGPVTTLGHVVSVNALPARARSGVQAATGVGPVVASLHRVSTNQGADAEAGVQLATGTSAVTLVWQARASHEVSASGVDGSHETTAVAGDTMVLQVLLVKPLLFLGSSLLVQVEPCTAVGPTTVTGQLVAVN